MSLNHHEGREAGTIILSQLKMFNEAMVVFTTQIEPAFWKGFDNCIARFVKMNGWECQLNFSQNDYCWLAPKHWKAGPKKWICWFETHNDQYESGNANLAAITKVGVKDAKFGFCFEIESSHFGGSKKLETYIKHLNARFYTTLVTEMDFIDFTDGRFFLPFNVDLNLVTQCWQEFGEFPEDHPVFAPVREAMQTLRDAVCTFDEMFLSRAKESKV